MTEANKRPVVLCYDWKYNAFSHRKWVYPFCILPFFLPWTWDSLIFTYIGPWLLPAFILLVTSELTGKNSFTRISLNISFFFFNTSFIPHRDGFKLQSLCFIEPPSTHEQTEFLQMRPRAADWSHYELAIWSQSICATIWKTVKNSWHIPRSTPFPGGCKD